VTSPLSSRFWLAAVAGGVLSILFLVTLAWPNWIELVLGVDPDGGSGAAEWLIVALSGLAATACCTTARLDWRVAHSPRGLE
jgi:hypothetical protein